MNFHCIKVLNVSKPPRESLYSQGTTSNGNINKYLKDPAFDFKEVVSTKNFFEYVLENDDSFDALFDNPPWDKWFLNLYFRFVRFMEKPCILVLPKNVTTWETFLKVFGRSIPRSILSNGTLAENEMRSTASKHRTRKRQKTVA